MHFSRWPMYCTILVVSISWFAKASSFEPEYAQDVGEDYYDGEASASVSVTETSQTSRTAARRRRRADDLSIIDRGEMFWNRGGVKNSAYSERSSHHYYDHEKFFERALQEAKDELCQRSPQGFTVEALRTNYMGKVREYHHYNTLVKGVEKYKREKDLDMSISEYEAVRNHFLNPNPFPEVSFYEKRRMNSLKCHYRKKLEDPNCDRDRIIENLRAHGWTLEDLKPYVLPPVTVIRRFVHQLRAQQAATEAFNASQARAETEQVNIPIGRSNRELDIDLNQAQCFGEEDNIGFDLNLDTLEIYDSARHDPTEAEEEHFYGSSHQNMYT